MVNMLGAPILFFALFGGQEGALSTSDPAKAVAALQEAIRRQPEAEGNYTELGNLLLRTQNFPQAALVLEAARSRFPRSPQVALSLGVAYYGQRKFGDAVGAFVEAANLAPGIEQPVAFLSRLSEHWNERKLDVEAVFLNFSAAQPRNPWGHFALGKLRQDAALLQRALALNPRFGEAHFELGAVLEGQRDWPAAIRSFLAASQLAPKNPAPHYRLARLYARTGDRTRADAERALHEKLAAEEKAAVDQRQSTTKHLSFGEAK